MVLAAPFEYLNIEFVNISLPIVPRRQFVKWFVTHVVADAINPAFFPGRPTQDPVPDTVYTTEDADTTTPLVSVKIVARTTAGLPIYKIFSNEGGFPLVFGSLPFCH